MAVVDKVDIKIQVPQGITAKYENGILTIKGPKGELKRKFLDDKIKISLNNGIIQIHGDLPNRKDYALAGTWEAHINNMIRGVQQEYVYKLKIVYAHFPMKVNIKNKEIIIENFLGEKTPRRAEIFGNVKVEVKNDIITVTGPNIEEVGQTAANIERATRIKDYDPRVFQDGIYIISKGDE